ncbi:hypothetical protein lerEdw1_020317 [Lerista edwardsae]|nr:hypothetical protein lerEdw1_020317 [Lerista edwardsae]
MVCGGFSCSKNSLCALNLLYTLVSLLLIGIAAWGIGFGLISSFRVVGVVVAVGIFLFVIALVGLIGAVKHHQVLLFFLKKTQFVLILQSENQEYGVKYTGSVLCHDDAMNSDGEQYMIILLLVFVIQFSVSCACLTLNKEQQSKLLEVGWNNTNNAKEDIERNLNCCGFYNVSDVATCSASCFEQHSCRPCAHILKEYSEMVLRFVGGIGLFFSFTEILGVWLTYRYRNQKDPRANPSAFL